MFIGTNLALALALMAVGNSTPVSSSLSLACPVRATVATSQNVVGGNGTCYVSCIYINGDRLTARCWVFAGYDPESGTFRFKSGEAGVDAPLLDLLDAAQCDDEPVVLMNPL